MTCITFNAPEEADVEYDKLIDEDGTFVYIGEAVPGTSPSSSGWRIKRVDQTNEPDVEIIYANGSADFNFIWDNRATYAY